MTYTYTETTTLVTSIHTSPARQQFLAVGGGRERWLSRAAYTDAELWEMAAEGHEARMADLWSTFHPEGERRWWEFWR